MRGAFVKSSGRFLGFKSKPGPLLDTIFLSRGAHRDFRVSLGFLGVSQYAVVAHGSSRILARSHHCVFLNLGLEFRVSRV